MDSGYYILAAVFILINTSQAIYDNKGTEFIVSFMENAMISNSHEDDPELFITTSKSRPVHVHVTTPKAPSVNLDKRFTITDGQVHYLQLDHNIRLIKTEMSSKGILIQSDDEIVVYGVNREEYSDDGYLALPTDVLGTEYYTASYSPATRYTLFMVICIYDNTQVSIRLANNAGVNVTYNNNTYHGGEWINVTMNRLDTFQIHSTGDLTGSYITSSFPVSILSGNKKTTVGPLRSSDHLVENLPPVQSWGKTFATVPIPDRTTGDMFRFIASEDHTNVTVKGNRTFYDTFIIKKAGSYVQRHYSSSFFSYISSDKPILLMQYSITQADRKEFADPAMIVIPPIEQYSTDYTFTTPRFSHGNYSNYFMFVTKRSGKEGLRLDGKPLPQGIVHHHIPGTHLYGGYVLISPGTHTVSHTSPATVIGGILFGKNRHESYGFPVGFRLAPINSGCKKITMTIGDEIDNDCDGDRDEEYCDGADNDSDGLIDEDCQRSEINIVG